MLKFIAIKLGKKLNKCGFAEESLFSLKTMWQHSLDLNKDFWNDVLWTERDQDVWT